MYYNNDTAQHSLLRYEIMAIKLMFVVEISKYILSLVRLITRSVEVYDRIWGEVVTVSAVCAPVMAWCAFGWSSRPNTAVLADDPSTDEHLTAMSPQRLMTSTVDHDTRPLTTATADTVDVTGDIAVSLVYHSSDFIVMPISDAQKVWCCNTVLLFICLFI